MKEYMDEQAGIYLRLMTADDTDDIVCWRNSEKVKKRFIYQGTFTREGHENWIKTMVKTGKVVQLMICELATDKAVGSVYVRDIDETHHKVSTHTFGSRQRRYASTRRLLSARI